MITFVVHFVELTPKMIEKIRVARSIFTVKKMPQVFNPEILINAQYKSIKKFHPNSEYILLTDLKTSLDIDPRIKIIRQPMETDFVDYESFNAKVSFLKNTKIKTHFIFLDWDMLLQSNLDHIFDSGDDLYFTFRDLLPMPINDGFIGVKGGDLNKTCEFFDFLLERFRQFSSFTFYSWYGLQLVLKHFFLKKILELIREKKELVFDLPDFKIRFLDGSIYNFNPAIHVINRLYPNKKIVHFSKSKKKLMNAYWTLFFEKESKLR